MTMASTAQSPQAQPRPQLELLHSRDGEEAAKERPAPLRLVHQARQSILIAGRDARRRSNLLAELSARLPEGTHFEEATATWEVLEHAPHSRMVMLAGDVEGSSTESVMHLLGNRHPQLPVLALGASATG